MKNIFVQWGVSQIRGTHLRAPITRIIGVHSCWETTLLTSFFGGKTKKDYILHEKFTPKGGDTILGTIVFPSRILLMW